MGQGQFAVTRGRRLLQTDRRQPGGHAVAQQGVLLHRKAMPGGQRQHEPLGGIGLHRVDCRHGCATAQKAIQDGLLDRRV